MIADLRRIAALYLVFSMIFACLTGGTVCAENPYPQDNQAIQPAEAPKADQVLDLKEVQKMNPEINWPAVHTITYGQTFGDALGEGSSAVPGQFVIEDAFVVPDASEVPYVKIITFMPADTDNYSVMTQTVEITVDKAEPTVIWKAYSAIYTDGLKLSDIQLDAGFSWAVPDTALSVPGGRYRLCYTPDDLNNYNMLAYNVDVVVNNPGAQYFMLDSGSGKPGDTVTLTLKMSDVKKMRGIQSRINYNPDQFYLREGSDSIVKNPGFCSYFWEMIYNERGYANFLGARSAAYSSTETLQPVVATFKFTIKESAGNGVYRIYMSDYVAAGDGGITMPPLGVAEVGLITVTGSGKQGPPDTTWVNWPDIREISYGQTFNDAISNKQSNIGTFEIQDAEVIPEVGTYTKTLKFIPNDPVNYTEMTKDVEVIVHKADPYIVWPETYTVTYKSGLKLSDITLPAGFAWAAPDTELIAGENCYQAIFTPEDTANYKTIENYIWVNVTPVEEGVRITASNVTGKIGGEVKVKIAIAPDSHMAAGSLEIGYDDTVLSPVEYTLGEAVEGSVAVANLHYTDEYNNPLIKVVWAGTEELNNGGNIILVTFKINENAPDNVRTVIKLPEIILVDMDENPIAFNKHDGSVTAVSYMPGDVNNDDKVNILDAFVVLKYDAGLIQLTDEQILAGDVNKDGAVDIIDAMQIQKYDVGLSDTLEE